MSKLASQLGRGAFVITAEIVPPLSASPVAILEEAEILGSRVTALNVTDAAAGRTTMSSYAAAAILACAGFEPVLQVTCRDRNRIALAGDLLGAAAQGVRNLLIMRGDDPDGGDQPEATAVFDLEAVELMGLANNMVNEGKLPGGRAINPPPQFFIGAADLPRDPEDTWSAAPLLGKAAAGAQFVQTQFGFDIEVVRKYMARLNDEGITEKLGIIIGVGPIRSARSARWMNENLYGVNVPEAIISRLEKAADQQREGRNFCAELISELQGIDGVAGAHVMAPGQGSAAIAEILDAL